MILFEEILQESAVIMPPVLPGQPKITWAQFYKTAKEVAFNNDCELYPRSVGDESANYFFRSRQAMENKYENVQSLFHSLPDPFNVYRIIGVKKKEDIRLNAPGSHWTWTTNNWAALVVGAIETQGDSLFVLSAICPKNAVDWKSTLEHHIEYSDMDSEYYDEQEIFIPKKSFSLLKNIQANPYNPQKSK